MIAKGFLDPVGMFVLLEELIQPLARHIALNAARIDTRAGERQRFVCCVRGKDFHVHFLASPFSLFGDQHSERVGFFATGARAHPSTDWII